VNAAATVGGSFRDQHERKKWLVDRSLIPMFPRIELGQRLSPELLLVLPIHGDTHLPPQLREHVKHLAGDAGERPHVGRPVEAPLGRSIAFGVAGAARARKGGSRPCAPDCRRLWNAAESPPALEGQKRLSTTPPLHSIRVLAVEAEEDRESPEEGSS